MTLTVIGEGSAAGTWTFDPKLNRTLTATQGASNGVVSNHLLLRRVVSSGTGV